MTSGIDAMRSDIESASLILSTHGEPSLAVSVKATMAKAMLLACASDLEARLTSSVISFFESATGEDVAAVEFVRNKALARQFHTLFDWDKSNANRFFSLFGSSFREYASSVVSSDGQMDEAVKAFLSLGASRNLLVHNDFVSSSLTQTPDEIGELYGRATLFVERLPLLLSEFKSATSQPDDSNLDP